MSHGIRGGALDRGTVDRLGGLSGGGAAGPLLKLLSGAGYGLRLCVLI